ncbi:MAG: PAS domain-containing protein [Leptolyngbyaceae cyanobacterium SL_7_1]|nr:PAS domain-containing protein [Leptolyngbyaceae cyanobacterium SL_7_1]
MVVQDDLALVLEQVGEAIALFSADWRLLRFNSPFQQLWNLDGPWLHTHPSLDAILLKLVAQDECSVEQSQQLHDRVYHAYEPVAFSLIQQNGSSVQMRCTPTTTGGWLLVFQHQRLSTLENTPPSVTDSLLCEISHRKRIEEELRRSEATNSALIQVIPDLLIRMNRNGTYLDFFPAKNFRTIMPFNPMRGRNIREIMPPDVVQERMHYVEQALRTGEMQCYEFHLEIDRTRRVEEARIVVCGVDEVLVIIRDITARKRAETALHRSEQLYRTLAENFPNGMVMLFDQELRYQLADGTELAALGLDGKEAVEGKTLWEAFPDLSSILEPRYRTALTGISETFEINYANQSYLVSTHPVCNDDGAIFMGMSVSQNITRLKQLESVLRQTNRELGTKFAAQSNELQETIEQLHQEVSKTQETQQALQLRETLHRSMITALHEGIILLDAEGKIQLWNASAERILGIPAERACGYTCEQLDLAVIDEMVIRFPALPTLQKCPLPQGILAQTLSLGSIATMARWFG